MRIAAICEYFHPDNSGGTPTDLSDLTARLKELRPGYEIDVITSRNLYRTAHEGPLPLREVWRGLAISRLRTPRSNQRSMARRLAFGFVFSLAALVTLVCRRRYDWVFIVTNPPSLGFTAWAYRLLCGVPYIYLIHDLYPDIAVALKKIDSRSTGFRVFRRIQGGWLHAARHVVVLGRCMQQHLEKHYALPVRRSVSIPSWASSDGFADARAQGGYDPAPGHRGTVLLYAGNFSIYAKIDLFLDAAALLRERTDILWVFIGDGTERERIQERIAREKLGNVRLLPRIPRDQMGAALRNADIALLSLEERMVGLGVPSKLYTIMATGRAVLASVPRGSEVAHVLAEDACGRNIPDARPGQIADAARAMIDDPGRLQEYGRNARLAAERHYTIDQAALRFAGLFEGLPARDGKPEAAGVH